MAWQVHRESMWWVIDENVASGSQAREGREGDNRKIDTQSVPAQTGCGWILKDLKGTEHGET